MKFSSFVALCSTFLLVLLVKRFNPWEDPQSLSVVKIKTWLIAFESHHTISKPTKLLKNYNSNYSHMIMTVFPLDTVLITSSLVTRGTWDFILNPIGCTITCKIPETGTLRRTGPGSRADHSWLLYTAKLTQLRHVNNFEGDSQF